MSIPFVRIGGTPYAIGHDTGRQLRELLQGAVAAYRAEFVARYGWERVVALVLPHMKLRDHANYPKGVCKHVAPGVNEHVCTIGSVIADLTAGELHVCAGNPCEGEYEVFRLG